MPHLLPMTVLSKWQFTFYKVNKILFSKWLRVKIFESLLSNSKNGKLFIYRYKNIYSQSTEYTD